VQIGKLGDTESLEGFGQAWQSDGLPRDFHIKASAEKPIAGGHEGVALTKTAARSRN